MVVVLHYAHAGMLVKTKLGRGPSMKRVIGLSLTLMLGVVLATVGAASALPLIEGESHLFAGAAAPTAFIRVDWQVFAPGNATAPLGATAGLFQYVYQLEATVGNIGSSSTPNDIGSFTITFTPGIPFLFLAESVGNLVEGSEVNPASSPANAPLTCCVHSTSATLGAATATWTFVPITSIPPGLGNIPQNGQSDLLLGLSPIGPGFGDAGALDGQPESPWATTNPGGERIPVPTPEPGTVLLLVAGLASLGTMRFGRK